MACFCNALTSRTVPQISRPSVVLDEAGPLASNGRANGRIQLGNFADIFAGSNSPLSSNISGFLSHIVLIYMTYSSSVIRASRSSKRASTGAFESLNTALAGTAFWT
jgi:hypothetical protein